MGNPGESGAIQLAILCRVICHIEFFLIGKVLFFASLLCEEIASNLVKLHTNKSVLFGRAKSQYVSIKVGEVDNSLPARGRAVP